ncbi:MAG: hypothetical protein NVSMB47_20510 [Polyangiales bacterium]
MAERTSGEMSSRPGEAPTPIPLPRKKARRGFAAMSPEKQREIASLGGKAAHAKGTAHEFSPEEAREAGRKGGQAAQRARATPGSEADTGTPTKH